MIFGKLIKSIKKKENNCNYHLKNIELFLFDKNVLISYLRFLTDSILTQQLGFCIGAEMPDLKLCENSLNIPSYFDYTKTFGETYQTPNYDISQMDMFCLIQIMRIHLNTII